jgi:hypothetical protein
MMVNSLIRYFFKKSLETQKDGNIFLLVRETVSKNIQECTCLTECFNKCKLELL